MLKRLHLKSFTVFADGKFEFGPGLNVVVGTNGTGKSHVLKLCFGLEILREKVKIHTDSLELPRFTKIENASEWGRNLSYYLPRLFQIERIKQLVSVNTPHLTSDVKVEFQTGFPDSDLIHFGISADNDGISFIYGGEITNETIDVVTPIFIPSQEVLTSSWILSLWEQCKTRLEQSKILVEPSCLRLLEQLRGLRERRRKQPKPLGAINLLKNVIGGEIQEEAGKYYLLKPTGDRIEVSMVSEGLRKFGMLQRLLIYGSLIPQATLYWDEPESNLNPALLRELAGILAELTRQGFQIILATHSMSLLKQFHILSREKHEQPLSVRYFGLNADPGQDTVIVTVDDFELLPDVVALNVELDQADALEEIFAREDQQTNHLLPLPKR